MKPFGVLSRVWEVRISKHRLAQLLKVVFFLSLIPLVLIALYNYPADDDFGFTLPAATAWVETGSLGAVLRAIWQKTVDTYMDWQGDFVSTFFFGLTPMVFNIDLYFLSNWLMLALVCLSAGYLVKGLVRDCLHADRDTFWIAYFAVMVLLLQFMPSISYSIFWHNGGQYTTAACTLYTALGLILRLTLAQSRRRFVWRSVCLSLCAFMLGGSFYGPALGAFVLLALLTATAFSAKSRARLPMLLAVLFFTGTLAISVMAPGVALRQERTGETAGAVATVVTAVLDSFDLCGEWLSPELFAMLLLILPTLWQPLKESAYRFRHPLWVFVMLYGLFSASLAPGIYTGYGYDTARYLNAIYFYFIIMAVGSAVYFEGALIRRLERGEGPSAAHALEAARNLGKRFCAGYLALVIFLTAMGGFAFTIMNTSSVSAARSLLTGEAKQFHQEMKERETYIRITDSDVVDVKPLSVQPYVFKNDRLPWQGIYGRVRYMKWYFELFYQAENPDA